MQKASAHIETSLYRIWDAGDGIFVFRWADGVEIDLPVAQEGVAATARLIGDRAHCLLVKMDGAKSMNREARAFYAKISGPRAVAMVGISPVARVIGNMFLGINKFASVPCRMFAEDKDAMLWLKKHID